MCYAGVIHNFKWVKIIQIWQTEVNDFEILLIDITIYSENVWKLVFYLSIKSKEKEHTRDRWLKD